MNWKWFTVGLVVGLIVAATTWFLCSRQRCTAFAQSEQDRRLQLVKHGDPEFVAVMEDLEPGIRLYILQCDGRDAAGISLGPEGIERILVPTPNHGREVSIGKKNGRFPGEISVTSNQPGGHEWISTVDDLDLDGIPDRRMDWKAKQMFDLDSITWKPRPKQQPEKK